MSAYAAALLWMAQDESPEAQEARQEYIAACKRMTEAESNVLRAFRSQSNRDGKAVTP